MMTIKLNKKNKLTFQSERHFSAISGRRVTLKMSGECMGVRIIFSGGAINILLILFRLLTMKYKSKFKKCFTISTPQRKCPMLRQQSQKCASLPAIANYISVIYTIGYERIF